VVVCPKVLSYKVRQQHRWSFRVLPVIPERLSLWNEFKVLSNSTDDAPFKLDSLSMQLS